MKRLNEIKTSILVLGKSILLLWRVSKKAIFFMVIVGSIDGLVLPISLIFSKNFLDALTLTFTSEIITAAPIFWLIGALIIQIISSLLGLWSSNVQAFFSENLSNRITDTLLCKIVVLPMSLFDDEYIYNKLRLALNETPHRCSMIIQSIVRIFSSIVQIVGVISIVLSLDWIIMLICILTAIPLFFVNTAISKFWFKISKTRSEGYRKADTIKGILIKNDNIKEIKLFGIGNMLKDIVISQYDKYAKENKKHRRRMAKYNGAAYMAKSLVSFFLKIQSIILSISRKHTIGTATMFLSAIDTFQSTFASILLEFSQLYEHALYIQYMFDIQDITEDESDNELDGVNIHSIEQIDFCDVCFKYPKTDTFALKNLTLTLQKNKAYALVGLNGSGKTTLIKLLLKLYIPTSGSIKINGVDISKINASSLRKNISAVFQDFIRYPLSVNKNISFGDISIDENQQHIANAAKYADAIGFIDNLPDKFETQLQREWTEGSELSGGQWQKLAIARGIYKECDMILFDEPFSSLDVLSEEKIIRNLKESKKNKLLIFVTHRYSSISLADQIFVLNEGELVETGTHAELMKLKMLYFKVFSAQASHLKDD